MNQWLDRAFLLAAGLVLTACGSNGDGDPIDRLQSSQSQVARILCPCIEGGPDADVDECIARGEIRDVFACYRRVYDANTTELDPSVSCAADAAEQYVRCLRDLENACPGDGYQRCTDEVNADLDACPAIPASVAAEWNACDPDE